MRTHKANFASQWWPLFFRAEKSASRSIAHSPLSWLMRMFPALIGAFLLVLTTGCAHKQQELAGISVPAVKPEMAHKPQKLASIPGPAVKPEGRIALIGMDPSAGQSVEIVETKKLEAGKWSTNLGDIDKAAGQATTLCFQMTGPLYFIPCVPILLATAGVTLVVVDGVCPTCFRSGGSESDDYVYWKESDLILLSKAMEEEHIRQQVANQVVRYADKHGIDLCNCYEGEITTQQGSMPAEKHCAEGYWAKLEIEGPLVTMEQSPAPPSIWTLGIHARAKLTRSSDQTVLADGVFVYNEGNHYYVIGLMDNDAELFREELNSAIKSLSEDIINTLFIKTQLPNTIR